VLASGLARAEGGVAHAIAAGIDTIHRPEVPSVANLALLARIIFADDETGETHQVEVWLHDPEGERRPTGDRPGQPGTLWLHGMATGGRILSVCVTLADRRFVVTAAWLD
jgi:hypothetical protein